MKRPNAAPVHDALAVASIVDPAVISTTFLHVDVETTGELTVGETVVDTNHRGDGDAERARRARRRRGPVRRAAARDLRPDTPRPDALKAAWPTARDATLSRSFHGRSCEAGVPVP